MDLGNIGFWIVLGVLVACCVVPMLMMGRQGKRGTDGKGNGKPPSSSSGR